MRSVFRGRERERETGVREKKRQRATDREKDIKNETGVGERER